MAPRPGGRPGAKTSSTATRFSKRFAPGMFSGQIGPRIFKAIRFLYLIAGQSGFGICGAIAPRYLFVFLGRLGRSRARVEEAEFRTNVRKLRFG